MSFNEAMREALARRQEWGQPLWLTMGLGFEFQVRRKGDVRKNEMVMMTLQRATLDRLQAVQDRAPHRWDEVVTEMLRRLLR